MNPAPPVTRALPLTVIGTVASVEDFLPAQGAEEDWLARHNLRERQQLAAENCVSAVMPVVQTGGDATVATGRSCATKRVRRQSWPALP